MGGKILGRAEKALIKKRIKKARRIVFFLDYDGTLTPIRKKPHYAKAKKTTKKLLKNLAKKPKSKVYILSGRELSNIKRLLGVSNIYYIGNHGIEAKGPGGFRYVYGPARRVSSIIQKCHSILKKRIRFKGTALENKKYTLSLHYRGAKRKDVPLIKKSFFKIVESFTKCGKLKITKGKEVLEVRPNINWNKGSILLWVMKDFPKSTLPFCIGDDKTDEDAFKALGGKGISILVCEKNRRTKALYRLRTSKEVIDFLSWILFNM